MNKKILISLSIVAAVAAIVVGATTAYFSDTGISTGNTFTAGTLNLQLADNDETWKDGVTATWVSPANWAPGEKVEGTLRMTNTGSIGVKMIAVRGESLTGTTGPGSAKLADAILLTKMVITGTDELDANGAAVNVISDVIKYGAGSQAVDKTPLDADNNGKLTLREFVDWCARGNSIKFWADVHGSNTDYLSPNPGASEYGDWEYITLDFTFDPEAGNPYQGLNASFDLRIVAYQTYVQEPAVYGPGL